MPFQTSSILIQAFIDHSLQRLILVHSCLLALLSPPPHTNFPPNVISYDEIKIHNER